MSVGLMLENVRIRAGEQKTARAAGGILDGDLLQRVASGDSGAMDLLIARYQSPLYRFLYHLIGSKEDAEDAAIEVFVRVWRYAGRFRFQSSVTTWLYRIALNIARDARNRHAAQPRASLRSEEEMARLAIGSAEEDAIETLGREERKIALYRALQRLSPSDRLLVVLYYLEERDYDEVRQIVGASYSVLKVRMARARRRLRKHFEEECAETELLPVRVQAG